MKNNKHSNEQPIKIKDVRLHIINNNDSVIIDNIPDPNSNQCKDDGDEDKNEESFNAFDRLTPVRIEN